MRGNKTAASLCGLVQIIRLRWTKSARGGAGARERNAVPAAFAIPPEELRDARSHLIINASDWDEQNSFASAIRASSRRNTIADGFSFGCVSVSEHSGSLQIHYRYDQATGGAPDRSMVPQLAVRAPRRSFTINSGQWGQVCYNGRFSCIDTGNWWYEQVTFNVAWFSGEPDGRVFLDRQPSEEFRTLAALR